MGTETISDITEKIEQMDDKVFEMFKYFVDEIDQDNSLTKRELYFYKNSKQITVIIKPEQC